MENENLNRLTEVKTTTANKGLRERISTFSIIAGIVFLIAAIAITSYKLYQNQLLKKTPQLELAEVPASENPTSTPVPPPSTATPTPFLLPSPTPTIFPTPTPISTISTPIITPTSSPTPAIPIATESPTIAAQ